MANNYTSSHTGSQIDLCVDTYQNAQQVQAAINAAKLAMFPVGSIYISTNGTNPSTFIGGTWKQIQDTFLLACGETYAAGDTGGEAEHILNITEMPSHQHQLPFCANDTAEGATGQSQQNFIYGKGQRADAIGQKVEMYIDFADRGAEGNELAYRTAFTGGNERTSGIDKTVQTNAAHNNMPPYLVVYMWKRTA